MKMKPVATMRRRRSPLRPLVLGLACLPYAFIYANSQAPPAKPAPAKVSYNRDIAPLFKAQCLGCHSAAKPSGKLNLVSGAKSTLRWS
ncbi:MAG: hypothetical protein EOO77_20525 [Oxalobacteraceae bacterium]|nr:MAG: hypothetical protein EOO77_20525 [Oxalobacteraceae bacterium]